MWTIKYLATVVLITAITLVSGTMLWLSEEKQELDPFESWSLGVPDAPVTLHSFSDFT